MRENTRKIAFTSLILAAALVIGVLEHSLPPPVPALPFVRLGLSNTAILFCLITLGKKPAYTVAVLKSVIVPLFVGNPVMILYSLPASVLALTAAVFLTGVTRTGIPAVSVISSAVHNLSQLAVGAVIMKTFAVFAYLPYMLAIGAAAGLLTGFTAYYLIKHLKI